MSKTKEDLSTMSMVDLELRVQDGGRAIDALKAENKLFTAEIQRRLDRQRELRMALADVIRANNPPPAEEPKKKG